ncbi:unnamed protein product, partial [Iphiclides podalirius]
MTDEMSSGEPLKDLAALRQLLENETGGTSCPSCNMPFDKGKKRKLIDTCGHERCYACMFRNEACPICARNSQGRRKQMERYTPSPQRQFEQDWQSPMRLPKPPKQPSTLAQSCPTPPHNRRRFFLSPKSLRSPFGQRASRHSHENHVPLSDDEGGHIKQGFEARRQNDLYMRLGLLLGERRGSRNKSRDSCTSLASLDAHTLASHNTSPVSTLTGSSEVDAATPLGRDSLGSLASMSLSAASNCSSSSPGSRRHSVNALQSRPEELTRMSSGFFKNRKTAARRSARASSSKSSTSSDIKKVHPAPQLNLRPLFFEVPSTDNQENFSGRQWLLKDMEKALESTSSGILISGSPGTGKTALVLQLVEHSCFGRKRNFEYEELREQSDLGEILPEELVEGMFTHLASQVVAYHFCQADNNSTCLVGEFVHSLAAQLCQAPRLQSYREYLLSEPHLLSCLSLKECIADPDLAFMRGIIEPLATLRRSGGIDNGNSIVLVDGLCEAEYHRPDHGYTIASFLARHVAEMPNWLKIVATVRTQFLELTKQLPYTRLSLDESENVHKDLLRYFNARLQAAPIIETNIKCSTGKTESAHNSVMKFAQYVLHLSQGSFLFLKLILDLLERSHIVVKSTNYKVVPISLAQIFLLQFNLRFPTVQSFEKVTHILSVCLAALYPLTLVEIYYSVNSLLVDTFLPWDEFCHRFEGLADFLVKRIDNTYMFFHPSFREWLMRREDGESVKFLCDLRAGHCGIAYRLSRVQAPLDPEKTMELGHHILKAHMYRNLGPAQLGLCPRDLQAMMVATSSANVGEAIANLRNIYTPNVKVSRLMLLAGGSPNQITDCLGNAPLLCMYSYQGILAMVGLLIEFGADLEMTNSQGCTALSLACQRGHTDVAKRLIAAGSSLSHTDTAEQTPLVHAAKNGHRDTVIYLLGCQAAGGGGAEGHGSLEQLVPGSRHALIAAAQSGHLDIVEYLLDTAELMPDGVCPVTGETALTAACGAGHACVADALLVRGATAYSPNARRVSPLALAARGGRAGLPALATKREDRALERGADPDAVDADGISALGWACLRSRISTAMLLLDKGASIEQADGSGRTALALACGGPAELAEMLLERGASLERVDLSGLRPLDRAIGQRNVPVRASLSCPPSVSLSPRWSASTSAGCGRSTAPSDSATCPCVALSLALPLSPSHPAGARRPQRAAAARPRHRTAQRARACLSLLPSLCLPLTPLERVDLSGLRPLDRAIGQRNVPVRASLSCPPSVSLSPRWSASTLAGCGRSTAPSDSATCPCVPLSLALSLSLSYPAGARRPQRAAAARPRHRTAQRARACLSLLPSLCLPLTPLERVDLSGLRPLDRAIGQRNVPVRASLSCPLSVSLSPRVVNCFLRKGAKLGPTTWVMASGKPEFMLILLNKLLEDGNQLYRKNRPSEAAHRYQYALKKIAPLVGDDAPPDQVSAFVQLNTNLLLNLSRCKRKLNEPSEALELAARASVLRPNAFECAYAMARSILALNKPSEALPHARRALLLAPPSDLPTVRTLKALQQEVLTRINAGAHTLNGDNRSVRNFDSISLNMP